MNQRRKIRAEQHIMEAKSYHIIESLLPEHWVVREFNHPDYGIDLVIEIFEASPDKPKSYEALGEFLYVQVKSVRNVEVTKERLYPVNNVAKVNWEESQDSYIEADLIKYQLDTVSLFTVQQLGSSISFLLFLVDVTAGAGYFICLNDFIDKILRPKGVDFSKQQKVTIAIPAKNDLGDTRVSIQALRTYGKRAKLLAAFSKFFYQRNEIMNYFKIKEQPVMTYRDELEKDRVPEFGKYVAMLQIFISQIDSLDIWQIQGWEAINMTREGLDKLIHLLNAKAPNKRAVLDQSMVTWHSMCNLANIYEELVREWFLPKNLSFFLSYPDFPDEIENTPEKKEN